jgi:hypothetical protein
VIQADLPAEWLPDNKGIAIVGDDDRTHLLDLEGRDVALTPPGTTGYLITSDGKFVLAKTKSGRFELYPIGGGEPQPFPFVQPGDRPIRFSSDGQNIFVRNSERGIPGVKVYRVSLASGNRRLLWHLQSPRTTVANEVTLVDVTPDGTGYAYGFRQKSTVLYTVTGLN